MLPDFRLETHFSKWEFKAKYHLTASDAQSLSLDELLSMASDEDRHAFETMWLGYTETFGDPYLRDVIADGYEAQSHQNILCFAGASEGIYAANHVILNKDSHAIVITPNYQSHETLPASIGSVSAVALREPEGWALDIDEIASAIRPNTKLITINFPHNPTGAILPLDRYMALIALCRKHGIYILHDEIFHGLGASGTRHLPFIADIYERGLSLGVMSKSYGLPGLRIGWIACQDKQILSKMERMKHYLSICNSGPSEKLAIIALKNKDKILGRNNAIIDHNLPLWAAFFAKHADLFSCQKPDGSCMGFAQYKGEDGVETFTERLVTQAGVLLLPSSIYSSSLTPTPSQHFRFGYGRNHLAEGLSVMDAFLSR
ncbi:MAG: aminotransferase class I/II-fold pyridoxal phosphate-dependent enzyme [Candidatus Puniceispirillaceae bacterium]